MPFWQQSLLVLGLLWACQAAGTWMQMRHYQDVMRRITRGWPDGHVGASAARGTLGRGAVAIVVADPDHVVRQVFLMEGRSVFAKFREVPMAPGTPVDALDGGALSGGPKARRTAIAAAIKQIETRATAAMAT